MNPHNIVFDAKRLIAVITVPVNFNGSQRQLKDAVLFFFSGRSSSPDLFLDHTM